MFHRDGGLTGNRTRVQGFAVLCVTTPPSGRDPVFQRPRHREGRQLSDRIVRCNARTYKRVTFLRLSRPEGLRIMDLDRKSTRLNSSHVKISYAVFCLKKTIAAIE